MWTALSDANNILLLSKLFDVITDYLLNEEKKRSLWEREQVQSITGIVKVNSSRDTEVIFIDVKTGVNYAIPYITSGASETIKLEKGK